MKSAENTLRPRTVRAGDFGSADPRRRQRALQAVSGVVVQLLKLLGRAAPVADVRLVPDLPVPALDFAPCRTSTDSAAPTDRPARPTSRSRSAGTPSRCRCRCSCRPAPSRAGTGRAVRERLRHEADLDQRLHLPLDVRVEDAIDDRPVVDAACPASSVYALVDPHFSAGVPSPVVSRLCARTYTGTGLSGRKLGQQLLAVLHVGVVRFVVAEERPDRRHRPPRRGRVDANRHSVGLRSRPCEQDDRDDDRGRSHGVR